MPPRWGYLLDGGHVIGNSLVMIMTTANPQGGGFNHGFGTMVADDSWLHGLNAGVAAVSTGMRRT